MTDRPDLDPGLAQRLRELSEQRVRAQIASAKTRRAQQDNTRREFAERRDAGLRSRHAARKARLNLIQHHEEKTMQTIPTDLATWPRADIEHWLYRLAYGTTNQEYAEVHMAAQAVMFPNLPLDVPRWDHLEHAGVTADSGYTDHELTGIRAYLRRTEAYEDTLTFDSDTLPHMESLGGRDDALGYARSMLELLDTWHTALDSLHADLNDSNGSMGGQARKYIAAETGNFLRHLHDARREVCRYVLGTAGPEPAIDHGAAVYSDFPYIQLDTSAITN